MPAPGELGLSVLSEKQERKDGAGKPLCILNSFDSGLEFYVKYHDSSLFILLSSEQAESLAAEMMCLKDSWQAIHQTSID